MLLDELDPLLVMLLELLDDAELVALLDELELDGLELLWLLELELVTLLDELDD